MTSTNPTHQNPEGSRAQVQEKLELFISDDNFKVLALKGKWGVGKTHLVETFFEEQKQDYYYSSVFGISSIEQLKSQILANKGTAGKILKWVNSQSDRITKTKEVSLPNLPTIAGSAISIGSDLLFNLAFNSINGFICIDDLERKSKLGLDEILGFVENLIQKSNCKVILIYNEDELIKDGASKKALEEYREKVIDIEVDLNPTVEENFSLVFRDNDFDSEIIKDTFILTNTNNIRVLKKIKWNLEQFQPSMRTWHSQTRKAIIEHIIMISLAKLDTTFGASMLTILNINKYFYIEQINQNNTLSIATSYPDLTEEQIKNITKEVRFLCNLFRSRYSNLDLDLHIADLVNSCLFDHNEFKKEGELLNQNQLYFVMKEKLNKVYEPYYTSFGDCTNELQEKLNTFLEEYWDKIDFKTFENISRFCHSIKLDISECEKTFFENMIRNREVNIGDLIENNLDILNSLESKLEKYPELLKILREKITDYQDSRNNINSALERIYSRQSYNQADMLFLDRQSIDDYCNWLIMGNPNLTEIVRFCLGFQKNSVGFQNLELAIKRLAKKSHLNAVRAEKLFSITSQNTAIPDSTSEVESDYDISPLEYNPEHKNLDLLDWVKEQNS